LSDGSAIWLRSPSPPITFWRLTASGSAYWILTRIMANGTEATFLAISRLSRYQPIWGLHRGSFKRDDIGGGTFRKLQASADYWKTPDWQPLRFLGRLSDDLSVSSEVFLSGMERLRRAAEVMTPPGSLFCSCRACLATRGKGQLIALPCQFDKTPQHLVKRGTPAKRLPLNLFSYQIHLVIRLGAPDQAIKGNHGHRISAHARLRAGNVHLTFPTPRSESASPNRATLDN